MEYLRWLALAGGTLDSIDFAEGTFGGRPTATGWLAATAAKGTSVGSANLYAETTEAAAGYALVAVQVLTKQYQKLLTFTVATARADHKEHLQKRHCRRTSGGGSFGNFGGPLEQRWGRCLQAANSLEDHRWTVVTSSRSKQVLACRPQQWGDVSLRLWDDRHQMGIAPRKQYQFWEDSNSYVHWEQQQELHVHSNLSCVCCRVHIGI